MGNFRKLIAYYYNHDVSDENRLKVWQRIAREGDSDKLDMAMGEAWKQSGDISLPDEEQPRLRVLRLLGRAALWIVPLLLVGASLFYYQSARQAEQLISKVEMIQMSVPNGQRLQVQLPDSSHVWVNAGSTIFYPNLFLGTQRNVWLAGEAYFTVKHDDLHPFVVHLGKVSLTVLGTEFNALSEVSSGNVVVNLMRGSVALNVKGHSDRYRLRSDDEFRYDAASDQVTIHHAPQSGASLWKDNIIVVNDEPLPAVLSKLERMYGIRCHIENTSYNGQRLHAEFNQNEQLDTVLSIIRDLIPGIRIQRTGNEVYVK